MDQLYLQMKQTYFQGVSLNDMVGGGDPKKISQDTLAVLKSFDAISEDSLVLDVGCGCGRAAVEQAVFLSSGCYCGFDIIPSLIEFCKAEISSRLPNTKFFLSNDSNDLYQSYIEPAEQFLEFDDLEGSPDLITAFSVFTHFDYDVAMSYFRRMRKKISENGRICISSFLINESSRFNIARGVSNLYFDIEERGVVFGDKESPLTRVGWNEEFLRNALFEVGLDIDRIIYGNWSGRVSKYYQDYLLLMPRVDVPSDFEAESYLRLNKDVGDHGSNPFHHYLNFGRFEGREYK